MCSEFVFEVFVILKLNCVKELVGSSKDDDNFLLINVDWNSWEICVVEECRRFLI